MACEKVNFEDFNDFKNDVLEYLKGHLKYKFKVFIIKDSSFINGIKEFVTKTKPFFGIGVEFTKEPQGTEVLFKFPLDSVQESQVSHLNNKVQSLEKALKELKESKGLQRKQETGSPKPRNTPSSFPNFLAMVTGMRRKLNDFKVTGTIFVISDPYDPDQMEIKTEVILRKDGLSNPGNEAEKELCFENISYWLNPKRKNTVPEGFPESLYNFNRTFRENIKDLAFERMRFLSWRIDSEVIIKNVYGTLTERI